MARTLTAAMIAALTGTLVRPAFAVEVETTSGFIRVWSGIGTKLINGNSYTGVGDFGSISPVKETTDLEATGVTFSLSGISGSFIALALGSFRQSFPATLLFLTLDSTGAVIADPFILYEGLTDVPEIDEDGDTAIVSITSESKLRELERPKLRLYTSEDQQLDFPGDLGFQYVPSIQDKEIKFGF